MVKEMITKEEWKEEIREIIRSEIIKSVIEKSDTGLVEYEKEYLRALVKEVLEEGLSRRLYRGEKKKKD